MPCSEIQKGVLDRKQVESKYATNSLKGTTTAESLHIFKSAVCFILGSGAPLTRPQRGVEHAMGEGEIFKARIETIADLKY